MGAHRRCEDTEELRDALTEQKPKRSNFRVARSVLFPLTVIVLLVYGAIGAFGDRRPGRPARPGAGPIAHG